MRLVNWKLDEAHAGDLECDGNWINLHAAYGLESLSHRVKEREVNLIWRKVDEASVRQHGSEQPAWVTLSFGEVTEFAIWPAWWPTWSDEIERGDSDSLAIMITTRSRPAETLSHPAERRVFGEGLERAGLVFVMMDGSAIEVFAGSSRCEVRLAHT